MEMEKYLGIYNNSTSCEKVSINTDFDDLHNLEFEYANTIEELEKYKTECTRLHIYEKHVDEYDNIIYKYIMTKGLK